jgi:sirohydrochlorin cobaltochelatase
VSDNFQDATLVLVGHGSTVNAESSAPVFQHARALRERHVFGAVLEAFWLEEPSIREALKAASTPRVFVVPLFISEGYFTGEIIPREIGFPPLRDSDFHRSQTRTTPTVPGGQTIYYCEPVGKHPSMTRLLLACARGTIEKYPFPRAPKPVETALFIAGHGTQKNEHSREAIERQVNLIRESGGYGFVQGVYLEEEPRVADCYQLTSLRNVIVVPFFISDGLHCREEIPVLLGEPERIVKKRLEQKQPTWRNPTERKGKLVWYTTPIGGEPGMAEVILEMVRAGAV